MESSRLEEENIIKEKTKKRNTKDDTIKDIRNLFRLKKKKTIKDRIIGDIRNLFENDEEDYYKPVTVGNFSNNNYLEYKYKGDRKTLSVEEYLNNIKQNVKRYCK